MKNLTKQRAKVVRIMQDKMEESERQAEQNSIDKILQYQKFEKHKLRQIDKKVSNNDMADSDFRKEEGELLTLLD